MQETKKEILKSILAIAFFFVFIFFFGISGAKAADSISPNTGDASNTTLSITLTCDGGSYLQLGDPPYSSSPFIFSGVSSTTTTLGVLQNLVTSPGGYTLDTANPWTTPGTNAVTFNCYNTGSPSFSFNHASTQHFTVTTGGGGGGTSTPPSYLYNGSTTTTTLFTLSTYQTGTNTSSSTVDITSNGLELTNNILLLVAFLILVAVTIFLLQWTSNIFG